MRGILLAMCLLVAGCSGTTPPGVVDQPALRIVARSDQCGTNQADVRLLKDATEASEVTGEAVRGGVDPEREALVLITLGTRPTPGYEVTPGQPDQGARDTDTFQLPIDYKEPPSDAILPQVLTTPCAVIAVERVPDVNVLSVPVYGGGEARVELTRLETK